MDMLAYLAERIEFSDNLDACWPWRLSVGSHGYGNAWNGETVTLAHRLMWTVLYGDPGELTIDHECRNRRCCNWRHLRLLTNLQNATDNGQGRKTHCPRGHAYDVENTYVNKRGHRFCRACQRVRRAERATP